MLRKYMLVIVAIVALGAASLAPTSAYAWHGGWHGGWGWRGGWGPGWRAGWRPGWGWRRGWGWGGPRFVVAPGFYGRGCFVRRLAPGPWGPRWILVNRCWEASRPIVVARKSLARRGLARSPDIPGRPVTENSSWNLLNQFGPEVLEFRVGYRPRLP